jgi:hypothetical protein
LIFPEKEKRRKEGRKEEEERGREEVRRLSYVVLARS